MKHFITEYDVSVKARQGVQTLEVDDSVVLTDAARESLGRYGLVWRSAAG